MKNPIIEMVLDANCGLEDEIIINIEDDGVDIAVDIADFHASNHRTFQLSREEALKLAYATIAKFENKLCPDLNNNLVMIGNTQIKLDTETMENIQFYAKKFDEFWLTVDSSKVALCRIWLHTVKPHYDVLKGWCTEEERLVSYPIGNTTIHIEDHTTWIRSYNGIKS